MYNFKYTKDNNEVTERSVQPIGFVFDDRDKVMCLDLTKFEGEKLEEMKELAAKLHRDFLNSIYDTELSTCFRQFFYDGINK